MFRTTSAPFVVMQTLLKNNLMSEERGFGSQSNDSAISGLDDFRTTLIKIARLASIASHLRHL
jgi:hypothetical protein